MDPAFRRPTFDLALDLPPYPLTGRWIMRRPAGVEEDRVRVALHGGTVAPVKFLVLWRIELGMLSAEMARAVGRMPEYGADLQRRGKVLSRYHIVGAHGGAWTYEVDSHEELERLLGMAPVFNFSRYEVLPLAEMADVPTAGGTVVPD